MVFNALRTDYFPRLSAVHNTQVELKETVLKQARVTILLITPIVIFFIVFSQLIIKILYSSEFLVISSLLIWAMLGMVFKATSFTLGYVILAKNDSKVFLKTSVIFNLLFLTMTVIGYKYFGLEGIGIAYFLYYIIHFISLKIIVNFKYKLTLDSSYYKVLLVSFILCLLAFMVNYIPNLTIKYSLFFVILTITLIFVYKQIHKLIDLNSLFKRFLNKN